MATATILRSAIRGGSTLGVAALGKVFKRLFGGKVSTSTSTGAVFIEISSNVQGEVIRLDRLNRTHQRIIARSLNKAVAAARTQTSRELSQAKGLPQKVLKRRIQSYKATARRARAALWVGTRKAITAKELGGNIGSSAGGHVKIGRRVFKSAFRARMPGGHTGIFTRKPEAVHKRRADGQQTQLPIQESVVQLMPEARDISRDAANFHLKQTFPKEVKRLARLALQKQQL